MKRGIVCFVRIAQRESIIDRRTCTLSFRRLETDRYADET